MGYSVLHNFPFYGFSEQTPSSLKTDLQPKPYLAAPASPAASTFCIWYCLHHLWWSRDIWKNNKQGRENKRRRSETRKDRIERVRRHILSTDGTAVAWIPQFKPSAKRKQRWSASAKCPILDKSDMPWESARHIFLSKRRASAMSELEETHFNGFLAVWVFIWFIIPRCKNRHGTPAGTSLLLCYKPFTVALYCIVSVGRNNKY